MYRVVNQKSILYRSIIDFCQNIKMLHHSFDFFNVTLDSRTVDIVSFICVERKYRHLV